MKRSDRKKKTLRTINRALTHTQDALAYPFQYRPRKKSIFDMLLDEITGAPKRRRW